MTLVGCLAENTYADITDLARAETESPAFRSSPFPPQHREPSSKLEALDKYPLSGGTLPSSLVLGTVLLTTRPLPSPQQTVPFCCAMFLF